MHSPPATPRKNFDVTETPFLELAASIKAHLAEVDDELQRAIRSSANLADIVESFGGTMKRIPRAQDRLEVLSDFSRTTRALDAALFGVAQRLVGRVEEISTAVLAVLNWPAGDLSNSERESQIEVSMRLSEIGESSGRARLAVISLKRRVLALIELSGAIRQPLGRIDASLRDLTDGLDEIDRWPIVE